MVIYQKAYNDHKHQMAHLDFAQKFKEQNDRVLAKAYEAFGSKEKYEEDQRAQEMAYRRKINERLHGPFEDSALAAALAARTFTHEERQKMEHIRKINERLHGPFEDSAPAARTLEERQEMEHIRKINERLHGPFVDSSTAADVLSDEEKLEMECRRKFNEWLRGPVDKPFLIFRGPTPPEKVKLEHRKEVTDGLRQRRASVPEKTMTATVQKPLTCKSVYWKMIVMIVFLIIFFICMKIL